MNNPAVLEIDEEYPIIINEITKVSSEEINETVPFTLEDIKNGLVENVKYRKDINIITLRMWGVEEKRSQKPFNIGNYTENGILNENKLLLDIYNLKNKWLEIKRQKHINKVKSETDNILDKNKKIYGINVGFKKGKITFLVLLTDNGKTKGRSLRVDYDDFEGSYIKLIEKYRTLWNELFIDKFTPDQYVRIHSSMEYYRGKFEEKKKEEELKNEINKLVEKGLFTSEGKIDDIGISKKSFTLIRKNGVKNSVSVSEFGYENAYEQILTKFCFDNNIEFKGEIWEWLYSKKFELKRNHYSKLK